MSAQEKLSNGDLAHVQQNLASVPAAVLKDKGAKDMIRSLTLFNLDALTYEAEKFFGETCTGCYLIAQGGFNTVYILTFKNHKDVVARLSASRSENPANKNQEYVIERKKSECAIYRFLTEKTTIPIPHIYYFTPYFKNPVGVPYMFMERVHGQILADVWFNSLSSEQQINVFNSVIGYNAQLLQLEFSAVGFLHHDDDGFTIGPLGSSCADGRVLPGFRGPFTTTTSYLLARAEAHLHSIVHNIEEWKASRLIYSARVVAVIDWDGSCVKPLWEDWPLQRFIAETMWDEDDKNLANQARSMQNSLYSKANPKFGCSHLNLGGLLILTDLATMALYSREFVNSHMLRWYEDRCNEGHLEEIRSFDELKSFTDDRS
ncbi:hypothetical protein BDQ12DRAFT_668719 [Crucibulum laeve]|uniref:Kinase-like domain-containing protein n=1 Tax=Crucibulum laeve TaxID=68775 RepID=A0A5C3M2G6_9AGAR|nr:hypothetical protein BDQ12DRAFT_668719 [Crucibulum laeve]